MTKEELSRAMIFVEKLDLSAISYAVVDSLSCLDCPINAKCPCWAELQLDEDCVPYNSCDEVIENYILTGEIVDRRKENGHGSR